MILKKKKKKEKLNQVHKVVIEKMSCQLLKGFNN